MLLHKEKKVVWEDCYWKPFYVYKLGSLYIIVYNSHLGWVINLWIKLPKSSGDVASKSTTSANPACFAILALTNWSPKKGEQIIGTPWYVDSKIPFSPACPINRRVLGWPRMSFCGNHDNNFTLALTESLDVPVNACEAKCRLHWVSISRFVSHNTVMS